MIDYSQVFRAAWPYHEFLARYGQEEHRRRWAETYERLQLEPGARQLLGGFVREMNLLVLAGAWCGDCAMQCPIFQRMAEACDRINLRFVDRDADIPLAESLRICGGARVPVVVFLSEDFAECARYGDRTLSRYRELAAAQLGAACPTGLGVSPNSLTAIASDWLHEVERVQLMLRISPRLRQKHGD